MKRLSKWVLFVTSGCLVVLVFSAVGGSSSAANGPIVFVKHQACNHGIELCGRGEIAVVNADGSGLRVVGPGLQILQRHKLDEASPRWSPDGREIAYIRSQLTPEFTQQVWLMAANGTHQRALTRLQPPGVSNAGLASLDWSPNGRQIVFAAVGPSGSTRLYLVNVRTGATRALLGTSSTPNGVDDPVWSPNGRWIAYVRRGGASNPDQIFLLSTANGHVRQLTHDKPNSSTSPTWSPDSRWIAFDYLGIYVMNTAGSHRRHLCMSGGGDPSWSLDGKWLVFMDSEKVPGLAEIRPDSSGYCSGYHVIRHFSRSWAPEQPDW